jgi:hypothetical protein
MWGLPEENEKHEDDHCCQQGGRDDEAGEVISTGQGKSYHGEYCRLSVCLYFFCRFLYFNLYNRARRVK